jgi:hypothetical protein
VSSSVHVAVVAPGVEIGSPPVGEMAPDSHSLFSTTLPATVRMHSLKPLSSAFWFSQSAVSAAPPPPPEVATMMLTTAITTTATTAVAMYQPLLDDDARCCGCCAG